MSAAEKLKDLGLSLPKPPKPVAAYVPWVRHGDVLHISGQIPVREGALAFVGRVGEEQELRNAQDAAKLCALNAIAVAADAAGGVDNIKRVLKVWVYVAAGPDFHEAHQVANGASELIGAVFGDAGAHARAAVGVAELPMNATVEVDALFAV